MEILAKSPAMYLKSCLSLFGEVDVHLDDLSEHPSIPFPSFPSAFHPVKCSESCTCRSPDEGKNVGSMPWALVWMCEFKWVVVVTFAVSSVLSVILQIQGCVEDVR